MQQTPKQVLKLWFVFLTYPTSFIALDFFWIGHVYHFHFALNKPATSHLRLDGDKKLYILILVLIVIITVDLQNGYIVDFISEQLSLDSV